MNHGYVQSPTRQVNQSSGAGWQGEHSEASRRALTLNVSKSIWPTRVLKKKFSKIFVIIPCFFIKKFQKLFLGPCNNARKTTFNRYAFSSIGL